jgi:hypothetical protein
MNAPRFAAFLLLPLAGCAANYDFAQARLPGGGYDVNKLIVDLKASGERRLQDGSWFPLIHLERVEFKPASASYPEGYILTTTSASGPLFFTAQNDDRIVDGAGALVESITASWFGWGLLHHSREHDIATTHGLRKHTHWRALLLFGRTDMNYGESKQKSADKAAAAPATTPN